MELIEHGRTGLLFRSDNVESLSVQLKTAIENRHLRDGLAKNAARFARERFSWENSARSMGEIYAELLQKHDR